MVQEFIMRSDLSTNHMCIIGFIQAFSEHFHAHHRNFPLVVENVHVYSRIPV